MNTQSILLFLADGILVTHVLYAAFVVFGLFAIYLGWILRWAWVRHFWFRVGHLVAIAIVVVQSWLGVICPLTTWEMALRARAGADTYSGSFIQHWFETILYYDFPNWVFVITYTVFGTLVAASWFVVAPDRRNTSTESNKQSLGQRAS